MTRNDFVFLNKRMLFSNFEHHFPRSCHYIMVRTLRCQSWARCVFWRWGQQQRGGVAPSTVGLSSLIWITAAARAPIITLFRIDVSRRRGVTQCCWRVHFKAELQHIFTVFGWFYHEDWLHIQWSWVNICRLRWCASPRAAPRALQHPHCALQPVREAHFYTNLCHWDHRSSWCNMPHSGKSFALTDAAVKLMQQTHVVVIE